MVNTPRPVAQQPAGEAPSNMFMRCFEKLFDISRDQTCVLVFHVTVVEWVCHFGGIFCSMQMQFQGISGSSCCITVTGMPSFTGNLECGCGNFLGTEIF